MTSISCLFRPSTPAWLLQRRGGLTGDPVQPGEPVAGHAGGAGAPLADGGGATDHGLLPGGVPGRTRRGGAAGRGAVRAAQHARKGEGRGGLFGKGKMRRGSIFLVRLLSLSLFV